MPKSNHEADSRATYWHQSSLELILSCSLCYYAEHVARIETPEKIQTLSGTAFHKAAELAEVARMAGLDGPDETQFLELGVEELRTLWSEDDDTWVTLLYELECAVHNYWHTPVVNGLTLRENLHLLEPVALEQYIKVPVIEGSRALAGTLDGIYRDPLTGVYLMVDYKTSKRFAGWDAEATEHRNQAAFYAAMLTVSPEFPIAELPEMKYYITRKERGQRSNFRGAMLASVQPDLLDIKILGDRVRRAEAIVAAGSYQFNPDYRWEHVCSLLPEGEPHD